MSRRISAKLTSLEARQNDLDGKVLDMLDKTQANSEALANIKVMVLEFLEKLKEQASLPLEPKFVYDQEQQPSTPIVPLETFGMHNLDPLDTFIIGNGNESTHSLPMGKIGSGYANGFGFFKL
jgi:hypothetical protein